MAKVSEVIDRLHLPEEVSDIDKAAPVVAAALDSERLCIREIYAVIGIAGQVFASRQERKGTGKAEAEAEGAKLVRAVYHPLILVPLAQMGASFMQ